MYCMVRQRSEVKDKYKWDVESLYTEKELENEIKELKESIKDLESFKNKLDDSKKLLEFLETYSMSSRNIGKLYRYASMKSDQDTRDQEAQGLKNQLKGLHSELKKKSSFKNIEIQEIGKTRIKEMIKEENGLEEYEFYLNEILRMKDHTCSREVEETLSSLSDVLDTSSETYKILANADLEFPDLVVNNEEVRITNANFTKLLKQNDKEVRKKVYNSYYGTLQDFENTIGTTFSKNIRKNVKLARIKNYSSAREAALYPSDIPIEVYDNLVKTVKNNLKPLHNHLKLKKEVHELGALEMCDVYLPVHQSGEVEISYEEAKKHVIESLEPLGEEYQEKVKEAFEDRWIDVYETEGKRSGAYSGGSYDTKPYILLNYQNDISSMYTLTHEIGHSMHSYLTKQNQNYLNSHYDLFVAEVASTTNEALLTKHLLETVEDEEFRRSILSHVLENFRSTLFRQTMFSDFEKQIHEEAEQGNPITAEKASKKYGGLKKLFYKPVEMDEHIEKEWMRIPHFYYNFYVYQYSTGISAAQELSQQILEEGPKEYLKFLESGGSDHPLKLLEKAGVDMRSPEPIKKAIKRYEEYVEMAYKTM